MFNRPLHRPLVFFRSSQFYFSKTLQIHFKLCYNVLKGVVFMLNPNVEQKLSTVCDKLYALQTISHTPIQVQIANGTPSRGLPDQSTVWQPFGEPFYLFEQNKYYWFRGSVTVPKLLPHQKAYLCIETFIGGVASTIRPQGLLFVDGTETAGIDINHTDVLLDEGTHQIYLHFYTHVFGTGLPLYFSLKIRDERVESAFYDFSVPLSAVKMLQLQTNDLQRSLTVLEQATNLVDFRNPHSDQFYSSLQVACDFLHTNYYTALGGSFNNVLCVAHTHIDVAWLWNLAQTKQKVERSFATVLKLMDEYPDYRFMMSQPQLFAFLKQTNPQLYARVKQRVAQGRWEVDGAMWLEADTNLTSGESLVRQMYYGQKFVHDEFGKDCTCVWLPDVFGYSGQLPQIIKKSGINRFVTAKIGWNDTDRFPYDMFDWEGIDGSKIFAYLLSTCYCDPRNGVYDRTYTSYCEPLNAKGILGTWNRFQQKDYTDTVLMSFGHGDGGGGPTRQDIQRQRRLQHGLPGLPKAKLSSLHDALDLLENNFRTNCNRLRRTPKWHGELYFEFHRGTLTSVPRVKMNNRQAEISLCNAEGLSLMAQRLCNATYPTSQLEESWKTTLLNQFHDILPGSSIEDVYRDSDQQFAQVLSCTTDLQRTATKTIASQVNAQGNFVVFNNLGFSVNGTVNHLGKTYIVKDVPAHGYKVVTLPTTFDTNVVVQNRTLENTLYRLTFCNDGSICSLFDKANNREIVPQGERINQFVAYEDLPYEYDNWEMTSYHKQKSYPLNDVATFVAVDDGDRKGFKVQKRYGKSTITNTVWLYNDGIARIDFDTSVVWREKGQLLKVLFPLDMLVDNARYDIQFGNVLRSTHPNTTWDSARFESVAHKWVDMAEGNYGVALLNNGKYGFGTEDNLLTMTILKSGSFPYDGATDVVPDFTYSLLPHSGDFTNGVVPASYVLNNPLQLQLGGNGNLPSEFSLVQCDANGVVVETVKQAEDGNGVIVRVFDVNGARHNAKLHFGINLQQAFLCDLMENVQAEIPLCDNTLQVTVKPYEIVTIKVK